MKYTVYDKYDNVLITAATARQCARAMGRTMNTFYRYSWANNKGLYCPYTILKFDDGDCILDGFNIKKLPKNKTLRVTYIANILGTTKFCLLKFCSTYKVPIYRSGKMKIYMINTQDIWRVYADCISE